MIRGTGLKLQVNLDCQVVLMLQLYLGQLLITLVSHCLQTVLSFHACGGNVGDTAQIPLPSWVLQVCCGPTCSAVLHVGVLPVGEDCSLLLMPYHEKG